MPAKISDDEKIPKIPNLDVAQWKFFLKSHPNCKKTEEKLIAEVKAKEMAPFYADMCAELEKTPDKKILSDLKAKNKAHLKKLDDKIEAAGQVEGDVSTDVRDAMIEKATYFSQIGDKEEALALYKKVLALEKNVTLGIRLDLTFAILRIGLFYNDRKLIIENVEKAKKMIDEGGDWDRRNRLKVYEGLYCITVRDFKRAAELFLGAVATFTSYELMEYEEFIRYVVIVSMVALPRHQLWSDILNGSEILEVLHTDQTTKQYALAFYNSHFDKLFRGLAFVEQDLKNNRFTHEHYKYYTREMRILAYNQQLKAYNSMSLEYMSKAFGVSPKFLDRELSNFITAGRIHAKIDKVNGIIETNRPDAKNKQYQDVIRKGDLLLNRVQKLSRVINI